MQEGSLFSTSSLAFIVCRFFDESYYIGSSRRYSATCWRGKMGWCESGVCHTEWSKSEREKQIWYINPYIWNLGGFPGGTSKESAYQNRRHKRHRFDPWVWKIPWRRNGNPLQYSCLKNPMVRGAWWAVHGVAKSLALQSDWAHMRVKSVRTWIDPAKTASRVTQAVDSIYKRASSTHSAKRNWPWDQQMTASIPPRTSTSPNTRGYLLRESSRSWRRLSERPSKYHRRDKTKLMIYCLSIWYIQYVFPLVHG